LGIFFDYVYIRFKLFLSKKYTKVGGYRNLTNETNEWQKLDKTNIELQPWYLNLKYYWFFYILVIENFRYELYLIKNLAENLLLNFGELKNLKLEKDNCLAAKNDLILSSDCKKNNSFICQRGIFKNLIL
jgi:hypothetical protein